MLISSIRKKQKQNNQNPETYIYLPFKLLKEPTTSPNHCNPAMAQFSWKYFLEVCCRYTSTKQNQTCFSTNLTDKLDIWWTSVKGFWKNIEIKWLHYIPVKKMSCMSIQQAYQYYFINSSIKKTRNKRITYFSSVWSYLKVQRPNWKSKKSMECWKGKENFAWE